MVFYHPKYYKELRKRNKSDQAISYDDSTESQGVRPDPGLKVSSSKHQAASTKRQAFEPTRSIAKRQASQPE